MTSALHNCESVPLLRALVNSERRQLRQKNKQEALPTRLACRCDRCVVWRLLTVIFARDSAIATRGQRSGSALFPSKCDNSLEVVVNSGVGHYLCYFSPSTAGQNPSFVPCTYRRRVADWDRNVLQSVQTWWFREAERGINDSRYIPYVRGIIVLLIKVAVL